VAKGVDIEMRPLDQDGVEGRCGLLARIHWHPQSMHAARLTAVADILFD
jgi:hypothetical protein